MKFYGLVTAAGFSSRFGSLKPVAEWEDSTFIRTILKKLLFICEKNCVVTGYQYSLISSHISDFQKTVCVYNKDFENGMFSSILKGFEFFSYIEDEDYIVFNPVDIPGINPGTLRQMKEYSVINKPDILKPSYNMKGGHPLFLKYKICRKILSSGFHKDYSLKHIIKEEGFQIDYISCDDPYILKDFDYSHDLISHLENM